MINVNDKVLYRIGLVGTPNNVGLNLALYRNVCAVIGHHSATMASYHNTAVTVSNIIYEHLSL